MPSKPPLLFAQLLHHKFKGSSQLVNHKCMLNGVEIAILEAYLVTVQGPQADDNNML